MITVERAKQIAENIRHENSGAFPKGPKPYPEITPSEDAEIRAFWYRIDGRNSYYTATLKMARGEHLESAS